MEKTILNPQIDNVGQRLDVYIADRERLSRSAVAKMIENGYIRVNGDETDKNYRIKEDDHIEVFYSEPEISSVEPENIPLDIVYEDNNIVVVNKPKGMVVHPAPGNLHGTLVNALLYHCGKSLSGIGGVIRPGIVHRIDKETSGLLVVAKNDTVHRALTEQLKDHTVSRVYHAIVIGNLKDDEGTIDEPIGRHPVDRKKMAVIHSDQYTSREAVTHYQVLERFNGFTYVKCVLETGRTHQIRVHMAYIGHPLLGDEIYGGAKTKFQSIHKDLIHGQCLHAKELQFISPVNSDLMTFSSDLPDEFNNILEMLRKTNN